MKSLVDTNIPAKVTPNPRPWLVDAHGFWTWLRPRSPFHTKTRVSQEVPAARWNFVVVAAVRVLSRDEVAKQEAWISIISTPFFFFSPSPSFLFFSVFFSLLLFSPIYLSPTDQWRSLLVFRTGVSLGKRPWFGENGSRVVADRRGCCRRGGRTTPVPFTSRNSVFIEHEHCSVSIFFFLLFLFSFFSFFVHIHITFHLFLSKNWKNIKLRNNMYLLNRSCNW